MPGEENVPVLWLWKNLDLYIAPLLAYNDIQMESLREFQCIRHYELRILENIKIALSVVQNKYSPWEMQAFLDWTRWIWVRWIWETP
jgi:hypothetical protein